ncbi:tricarballylate utilization 4Fe-4S protein TcuB [Rhizobiales bacterium RZME27]|uniref:Tricarballylate utilization 4Fe-4S protein TcuB n=1 Tax=Endobacterium cereale TaxID=2663029 RepID=A0A6A8A6E2_9HYPH|nr:tricarballylate utilization 4Fe-4S protein TcuB [Endobacterium cereale]MEB2844341.1 tricarballylate utilization 4Fe-4S protein TcuB [Endobacterium cereale]MQY46932.1 tricarballylate utilization 4Fe-4S protein TcuB [Endobacterium cereale]
MHSDETLLAEARRVLTICAVCDYCSGFCEVFRAIGRRTDFLQGDINYLAHLCHDCGNCLDACQYAPPHVFQIDPPQVLAEVRSQFWPPAQAWLCLVFVPLTPLLTYLLVPTEILFGHHRGAGAFYAILPWSVLCLGAGFVLLGSLASLCLGVFRFWRDSGGGNPRGAILMAIRDILTLRNLEGGGISCEHGWVRRWAHQALVAGVCFCFASTSVATIYHHSLAYLAPHPYQSVPVLLGSGGGVLMMIGCAGLWWEKLRRHRRKRISTAAEHLLLALLMTVSVSGFALLIWRDSKMMGVLLAFHFGTVLSLFLLICAGKLGHGAYRAAALLRAAMERRPR